MHDLHDMYGLNGLTGLTHVCRRPRLRRSRVWMAVISTVLLIGGACAYAQYGGPPTTKVHDPAALKPPPGVPVAILEFEDMECPECGFANPIIKAAAAHYHLPWIRHDFPLPFHAWSFEAAIYARWFDTKSKALGDEFRNAVFANQDSIDDAAGSSPASPSGPTPKARAAIRAFAQKFAEQHGVALPFMIDPQNKLRDEVQADLDLGKRIGINHTPTIWIITQGQNGAPPYTEVLRINDLYNVIDRVLAETGGQRAAK